MDDKSINIVRVMGNGKHCILSIVDVVTLMHYKFTTLIVMRENVKDLSLEDKQRIDETLRVIDKDIIDLSSKATDPDDVEQLKRLADILSQFKKQRK